MTTVLLFHHAQGQTTGFLDFAEELRKAGHTVHAPDLYDEHTFGSLDEGIAYAKEVGFGEVLRRGTAVAEDLPPDIVYAGFSLGVMPAQSLAQQRPGARGEEALVEEAKRGELFGYPGSGHLFADASLADYDEQAATLLMQRTLDFLERVG